MIRSIAAIDTERGIGKDGKIPWKIPTDERYFTEQTKKYGGRVLTGRTTYDRTYHGPLKERTNYILTHDHTPIPGATVVNDLNEFFEQLEGDLWIAGGGVVFAQTIDRTDELYLTLLGASFNCDAFFPSFEDSFELTSQSEPVTENGITFTFCIYKRK
jgi:dihydrofolate reductase